MTFTTAYACPTRLIAGGGAGAHGLCAMELLSVMTKDYTDKPSDYNTDVHPQLANMMVSVNDLGTTSILPEERTPLLWPILPAILGTRGEENYFPWKAYRRALGYPVDVDSEHEYESPASLIRAYAWRESRRECKEDRGPSYSEALIHAVEALKVGITLFHEKNGTTPLQDYTEEHMANLTEWLTVQKANNNIYVAPLESVT